MSVKMFNWIIIKTHSSLFPKKKLNLICYVWRTTDNLVVDILAWKYKGAHVF